MKYRNITIHKNKNCDTWYTRFRKNNKIVYITGKTQKECYNKLKKAYNSENIEKEEVKPTITLQQWHSQWLELYKIGKVKDDTLRDYKSIFKNIPEKIQKKDIKEIKLEELITIINETKAERTKQKVYELLMALFTKARNHDIIEKNLMERIEKPKHIKVNSPALTKKQEEEFIKVCKKDKNGGYFLLALYQGLRHGEALGLTFEDIDLKNKKLRINKSFNQKDQFDTTKNLQSNRIMPLFQKSIQLLQKYKGENKERIFNLTRNELETAKAKIQEKLSFKFKIKDLRTTFITRCQEKSIPEFIIQSWVGHKIGSKVTRTVYTKFNEEDNVKYINIFEDE